MRITYTLPWALGASDFEQRWNLDLSHPADVQNSLADCVGAEHVLETILDTESEGKTVSFWPEEGGEYFAYINNKKVEKVTAVTGSGTKTFSNIDRGYLLELGLLYGRRRGDADGRRNVGEYGCRYLPFFRGGTGRGV